MALRHGFTPNHTLFAPTIVPGIGEDYDQLVWLGVRDNPKYLILQTLRTSSTPGHPHIPTQVQSLGLADVWGTAVWLGVTKFKNSFHMRGLRS
jgi:hypothetical protein